MEFGKESAHKLSQIEMICQTPYGAAISEQSVYLRCWPLKFGLAMLIQMLQHDRCSA